jgi:hypothetical protein
MRSVAVTGMLMTMSSSDIITTLAGSMGPLTVIPPAPADVSAIVPPAVSFPCTLMVSAVTLRFAGALAEPTAIGPSVTVSLPPCPSMDTLPTPPLALVMDSDRASFIAPRFVVSVVMAFVVEISTVANVEAEGLSATS